MAVRAVRTRTSAPTQTEDSEPPGLSVHGVVRVLKSL